MSNLKAQIKAIQQQLALSSAETIARLKSLEAAIEDQSRIQQKALEQLLELVA